MPSPKKKPKGDAGSDKKFLLDVLSGWRDAQDTYQIQKEVAAWSAAALYVAGLLAIAGFILDKTVSTLLLLFLFLSVAGMLYSFIIFIQSHYNALYFNTCYRIATNNCISKLLGKDLVEFDFTMNEMEIYPVFLQSEYKKIRPEFCHYEKKRFFKILWQLWTLRRGNLSSHERQEAAIYSILIITTVCLWAVLLCRYLRVDF